MSWEPFFVGGVAINRDPTMNESRSCNDDMCDIARGYMCDIARGYMCDIARDASRAYTHTMIIML